MIWALLLCAPSFNFLSSNLMLINHCHFGNIITFSLQLQISRLTSRLEANDSSFCILLRDPPISWCFNLHEPFSGLFLYMVILLCLCWTPFSPLALTSFSTLIYSSSKPPRDLGESSLTCLSSKKGGKLKKHEQTHDSFQKGCKSKKID